MRLWHYQLLPYLPERQFLGQLRELVAVMRDWRDEGTTNHLLINRVMDYPQSELTLYFYHYNVEHRRRYGSYVKDDYFREFTELLKQSLPPKSVFLFDEWHNKEYLRICMANLYEKYKYGKGNSQITEEEWQKLLFGYKEITGEDYKI